MVKTCAAFNCSWKDTKENRQIGISFHEFPKDKVQRSAWAKATRREGPVKGTEWVPSPFAYLCSKHFQIGDFEVAQQRRRLRAGVVPSVFSFTEGERLPKRNPKSKESCKTGDHCTSTNVARKKSDETCNYRDNSLHDDTIQKPTKDEISEKLVLGIPNQKILSDIRGTADGDIKFHLPISHKALHNIRVSCGISATQDQVYLEKDQFDKHILSTEVEHLEPSYLGSDSDLDPADSDDKEITDDPPRVSVADNLDDMQQSPLIDEDTESMKRQIDDLKRKCSELEKEKHKTDDLRRKYSELEEENHNLVQSLSTFFNLDQLEYLKGKRHKNWSQDTITKAIQIESACGYSGYQTLIEQGYPLPSYKTLFIRSSGTFGVQSES